MEIIKFEKVTYTYPGNTKNALNEVSLSVNKGEFLAVLGHNGSGKSTLCKLTNGLILPTSGEVFVDGISTSGEDEIWRIRKKCAMVFQNPDNQIIASIVEDEVAFGPENLGLPPEEIKLRITEALAAVDMSDYLRRVPAQLSGGQKQRIAIAGVLAMRPSVIVFDEPTAMLDPDGRKDVMEIIRNLKKNGITIVLITHHVEEAMDADRVIVMQEGNIALSGSPSEIFSAGVNLADYSLISPASISLGEKLLERGIDLGRAAFNIEELAEIICQYAQKA